MAIKSFVANNLKKKFRSSWRPYGDHHNPSPTIKIKIKKYCFSGRLNGNHIARRHSIKIKQKNKCLWRLIGDHVAHRQNTFLYGD